MNLKPNNPPHLTFIEFYEQHVRIKLPDGTVVSPPPLTEEEKSIYLMAEELNLPPYLLVHLRGGTRTIMNPIIAERLGLVPYGDIAMGAMGLLNNPDKFLNKGYECRKIDGWPESKGIFNNPNSKETEAEPKNTIQFNNGSVIEIPESLTALNTGRALIGPEQRVPKNIPKLQRVPKNIPKLHLKGFGEKDGTYEKVPDEICNNPYHDNDMKLLGRCLTCGDRVAKPILECTKCHKPFYKCECKEPGIV